MPGLNITVKLLNRDRGTAGLLGAASMMHARDIRSLTKANVLTAMLQSSSEHVGVNSSCCWMIGVLSKRKEG